tara:strand:+ start:130 stop:312 length:183 start_codon:yes stop_codon:yes gene_type:complete
MAKAYRLWYTGVTGELGRTGIREQRSGEISANLRGFLLVATTLDGRGRDMLDPSLQTTPL